MNSSVNSFTKRTKMNRYSKSDYYSQNMAKIDQNGQKTKLLKMNSLRTSTIVENN